MLKLKKIQILGFKSFCDRTEVSLPGQGIAVVVGPNGCGKSNILEGVSWVLGEQSAKSLRGGKMEDVIFAGTRERKQLGMAEVSITLIDPDAYAGGPVLAEPEVVIENDLDWDEENLRAERAAEAEEIIADSQPGQVIQGQISEGRASEDGASIESAPSAVEKDATHGEPGNAVVLKIRRRKFQKTPQQGEIVVTRRLFRTGDSEYLLNGKLCRLRDIQDIFMGTGLGPESYAIIEQGRIGQILSSKPTDRRAIIEEAAGITKFKTRKRLAEARLEQSKQNLARVNDIFEEVTRQMNSLKRQAAKAERYARLRDEMRSKLRVLLASKFEQLDAENSALEVQLAEVGEELRVRSEAVQQMEGEHGERTQRGYAIERESQENREKLNNLALEIDRAAARRRTNEERCSELDARSAGAQAEIGNTEEQLTRLQQELQTNRATMESADADVTAAQQELQQRQQEASAAAASLIDVERQQEQRRDAILQAVGTSSALRNRITQAEERVAALDREAQRLHDETSAAHQQLESFGGQRGQLGLEFETASQRVDALTAQINETRQNLETKRAAETDGKRRLDSLRAEYAGES